MSGGRHSSRACGRQPERMLVVSRPILAILAVRRIIVIVIGVLGLISDMLFKWLNRRLFPWAQLGR